MKPQSHGLGFIGSRNQAGCSSSPSLTSTSDIVQRKKPHIHTHRKLIYFYMLHYICIYIYTYIYIVHIHNQNLCPLSPMQEATSLWNESSLNLVPPNAAEAELEYYSSGFNSL